MKKVFCGIIFFLVSISTLSQNPEEKIAALGIILPEVTAPSANFVKWKKAGNLLFLSGDGSSLKGKLGDDLSTEEGYAAARETGIEILATLKAACDGDLNRIKQFVKVRGMVNSAPDFYDQPKVINGFSDLMVEVFGEKGKHTRAAVGHCSLPSNIALEIEVIVELEE
ncbi:RidA family protein [Christiangramia sabulilitoris]|uniref:RidA family protein n=1 Tax=Christiangramia sabulilitoris TaxID=2583991 RepID=A0A550HZ57_9FLAO|nr:RidA family protein [Christiangramia sabulilitoris]TRO64006.1 RidA family protein [Christiangramia sabulilitoris]